MLKLWKSIGSRVWMIVTAVVLVFFIVLNSLAFTLLYELFNTVMPGGGPKNVYAPGDEPAYTTTYTSKSEVYNAARDMNQRIVEEGAVLLKNEGNALPLAKGAKISVFGKNSVNLAFGGSGSGGANTDNATDLYTGLKEAGFELNPELEKFYKDDGRSGPIRAGNSKDLDSGDTVILSTAETPQSKYDSAVRDSYKNYKDAAVIVITRIGGEGFDLPRRMVNSKGDGVVEGGRSMDDHFLQLDANEEDLIAAVCEGGFDKVIVLINTGNPIEVGFLEEDSGYVTQKGYEIDPSKIDAALWMGMPGESGTYGIGKILSGEVTPSGKLADTYMTDFTQDPTWFNFGDNRITGNPDKNKFTLGGDMYAFSKDEPAAYYFVDYEESIYVGYRYYETRGAEDPAWYDSHVVYPFGYGLSYTTFTWELTDKSEIENVNIEKDKEYSIQVKVTNSGDTYSGKEVVQLYAHAPYFDGEIEKSHVVLVGFAKTGELEPGASETVTLTFNPYYLASYDYKDANANGAKTFELDASQDYKLFVSSNAHDAEFTIPFTVDDDIIYDKAPVTGNTVENRFTDCEDERFNSDTSLDTLLSRSDWEGTFPESPTLEKRENSDYLLEWLKDISHNNPTDFSSIEYPTVENDAGMTLRSLLFNKDGEFNLDENGRPYVDYNDPRWQTFVEQAAVPDLTYQYNYAAYVIQAIQDIGFPRINCADGPVGWACFMDTSRFYETCSYCCQTLVATTWSTEVAYDFGEMVGDEGIVGDVRGGSPYSGWYAPGMNLHRSPFGGRDFEYYSEDSFLSGRIGASQIAGCRSKGVMTFVKHFVGNEQETHRSISGDSTWLTEQSLRELYLRPFEMAVKEGDTIALMTSFNRVGTRWVGGDYRMLTEILREEWGFEGTVLCDFNTIPAYMNSRQMAYAGGDLNLATTPVSWCDEGSAADVYIIQQNFKNTAYAVVNSNAMVGEVIGQTMAPWVIFLIVLDVLVPVGLGVWGYFVVRKALKPAAAESSDKAPAEKE